VGGLAGNAEPGADLGPEVAALTFLDGARHDRFYALRVLEATSGMRRCELVGVRRDGLDRGAGTLAIEITRVVINGRVVESDGKTENAQRVIALDPFTRSTSRPIWRPIARWRTRSQS
jgi:hypothetical protein